MRSLVRSVISEVEPDSIPATPGNLVSGSPMHLFFVKVKALVNAAFGALNDEVRSVTGRSEEWQKRAMDRGLKFMSARDNEAAIISSVAESDEACRTLTDMYFSAMNSFARGLVSKREMMDVNYKPFGSFIASLYRQLANDDNMKKNYFTTMSYSEKDAFLADALRRVMNKAVVLPKGMALPQSQSVFAKPLTPNDSVSNISQLPDRASAVHSVAASVVGQSVASKAFEAATQLVPDTLKEHESKAGKPERPDTSSRFSKFKQPSVVSATQRPTLKPKVITMTDIDKHALPSKTREESSRVSTVTSRAPGSDNE